MTLDRWKRNSRSSKYRLRSLGLSESKRGASRSPRAGIVGGVCAADIAGGDVAGIGTGIGGVVCTVRVDCVGKGIGNSGSGGNGFGESSGVGLSEDSEESVVSDEFPFGRLLSAASRSRVILRVLYASRWNEEILTVTPRGGLQK